MPEKFSVEAKILANEKISAGVFRVSVTAEKIAKIARPGQFVQVGIPGAFLRRPLGIADVSRDEGVLSIFYRVSGKGTKALSELSANDSVNLLGPLGRGFSMDAKKPLLVGGGMGLAPLLFLAKEFRGAADVLIGGRNAEEIFWNDIFKPVANEIFVTTDDGSIGTKGFVTALLPELIENKRYDFLYVCGPEIMMKKVCELAPNIPAEVSLERRMACGLGACLSCAIDAKGGRKKVCKDGPVFKAEEVFT